MKIYQSREELMADIARGNVGGILQLTLKIHEAEQARKGKPVSFESLLNALKAWGLE